MADLLYFEMKKIELNLAGMDFSIYEFQEIGSIEEFLRANKTDFYDRRSEISKYLDDEAEYKKFYLRGGKVSSKVKEDAAVWALARVLAKESLGEINPEIGDTIQIDPFGQDPTDGKSDWAFRSHSSIPNRENEKVDIDRLLFLKKDRRVIDLHLCQVYSPESAKTDLEDKLKAKNRQLPVIRHMMGQTANIEILFLLDNIDHTDASNVIEVCSKFIKKYNKEIRPNSYINIIVWSKNTVKVYRAKLL
ncbi:hypothetical protein EHQ27_12020 [Leptospira wolffii]|uniref:hypothetical protein n=1 Tax=Leptospira wolffii TaxID=409998 RepID=UPI0010832059|nr:hypothetical protein [Leptospira wolffii]TGK59195.1 hypothetical protein EHQ32_10390 [Leptospira wolffii]TGK70423.1 hypothetical protein EHQ27_12020 [Leptospira wolffii]TGK71424.1 hypothetical protein EHQ35_14955 [Leptospira wolffii]TGL29299.1 hypothetical protein EHQ57_10200 [Leptospira wolffii]